MGCVIIFTELNIFHDPFTSYFHTKYLRRWPFSTMVTGTNMVVMYLEAGGAFLFPA